MHRLLFCFSFMTLFFISCTPTYPKEELIDDIKELVEKESGGQCDVHIFDDTVYLDMQMQGLISSDSKIVNKAVRSLQNAVFAVTRVALSSDADIKIMVISAHDPEYNVALRMLQNIDDVKSYFYQRISRGDYEQRQLLEIEGPDTARDSILNRHHITEEEYVGRLIVSQVNVLSRTNPFLGALISSLNLRYGYIDGGSIYFICNGISKTGTETTLKDMISEQIVKNLQKYELSSIKSAIILTSSGTVVFDIPVNVN